MPDPILTVGNYQIAREIGRGSFATVYKAYSKINRAPVAIKAVLRSKLTRKLLESLETEIAILKGIRHNHIVQLVDCQKSDTHIHLIMEFCSLGDLSNYIKKKGDIPGIGRYPNAPSVGNLSGGLNEYVVRHFLKQLASALEFMRSQNLIHRDLKPQNLLLLPPPAIDSKSTDRCIASLPFLKVADFGFARFLPSQTLAETLCGSPLYMAPEILRYEKYDAKADLWSVGAVLYEMLVGKSPFRAQNHVELLRRIERGGDRIRFPGDEKLDRTPSQSVPSGTSPSQPTPSLTKRLSSPSLSHSSSSRSLPIAPQISEQIKELVCKLLKRNPVERISFEEFFLNSCITDEISIPPSTSIGQIAPSTASSPAIPIVQYSSSSPLRQIHDHAVSVSGYPTLQHQQTTHRQRDVHEPHSVQRRASNVPVGAHGGRPKLERNPTVSPLMERRGSGGVAAEIGTWRETGERDETSQRSTLTETTAYPTQRHRFPAAVAGSQPSSLPTYMAPGRDGLRPRSQTMAIISPRSQRIADSRRASEISQVDSWEKDEAAGRQKKERQSNARLPTAGEAVFTDKGNDGEEDGGLEKEYVVVEKRTVEVNSLADELEASPKFSARLSSRFTSPPGTPVFSTTVPRENKYIPRDQHDGSANPPLSGLDILSTTPPFAKGGPSSRQVVRSTSNPSVPSPSSLKTGHGEHGSGWTSHTATSKLAKAISTASARLFGSPTPSGNVGLGMVGGLTAAAVATGLGFGTSPPFLFGDMGTGSSGMAMVLFEGGIDPEEELILKTIEEYAQRAYVIAQFADSKVSALSSQRPRNSSQQPVIYEYQRLEQPPDSATAALTTTTGGSTSLQRLDASATNRTGAEEALVLYVKALAVLQMGMDVAKRYWSGDDKDKSEEGKRRGNRMPSVRLNNAVQWTRDCFNECLEKAEFVKTKCGPEGSGGQCAEKLIYDRAAEISRAAAVNELVGEDLMSCEVSYRTAVLLMKTLLEGPYEDGERMEEDDREVVSKFTASIESRLTALNQRLEMMTSRCSMGGGGASTSTIASGAGGDGGT